MWYNVKQMKHYLHIYFLLFYCIYMQSASAYTLTITKSTMKTCALASYLNLPFKECCFKYATKQGNSQDLPANNTEINNAPALGEEELEKLACEHWRGSWSDSAKNCNDQDGGGSRSMAIWNKTDKKYNCLNAIEYQEKLVSEGKSTQAQVAEKIDYWRPFIYDNNGLLKPGFQDMQWIIIPYDTEHGKCASVDERECYNQNGKYKWDSAKCYTHNNDEEKCKSVGAIFKTENGISYCDCKLPSTEFHWDSTGNHCEYKQGNSSNTYTSSYSVFFEGCLEHLKTTPFFNGNLTTKNCQQ